MEEETVVGVGELNGTTTSDQDDGYTTTTTTVRRVGHHVKPIKHDEL
jgi:hypothetical protein